MTKYYPPDKTAQVRRQITGFTQKEGETLYEVWDKFKELLRLCPFHKLDRPVLVFSFYAALDFFTRMTLDAAPGGAFIDKNVDEAFKLLDGMSLNHYQWFNEQYAPQRGRSTQESEIIQLLMSKVDVLTRELNSLRMNSSQAKAAVVKTLVIFAVLLIILLLIW